MVVITVEAYKNASTCINCGRKKSILGQNEKCKKWIRNKKYIRYTRKTIRDNPTEEQKKKYIRSEHQITGNPIDDKKINML